MSKAAAAVPRAILARSNLYKIRCTSAIKLQPKTRLLSNPSNEGKALRCCQLYEPLGTEGDRKADVPPVLVGAEHPKRRSDGGIFVRLDAGSLSEHSINPTIHIHSRDAL